MKLLLTGAFDYSEEQLDRIKSVGFDVLYIDDERTPLQIDFAQLEAVVCNSLFLYNDISNFKNLKLIQLVSAGLDRVPLEYINEKGIRLYNAGDVYSIPMAEWAVLKILEIYKKSRYFYKAQDQRRWVKNRNLYELTGKAVLMIGFGHIGQEIAKRLKPFGVELTAVDVRELEEAEATLLDRFYLLPEIDQALSKSDIVILTLPLTEHSLHLIDRQKLALMKEQSVLINISRGAIIDEQALIEALEKGRLLGVALDVFGEEPLPQTSPLWGIERVIITPHNSYISDKVNKRLFQLIFKNLTSYKEIF